MSWNPTRRQLLGAGMAAALAPGAWRAALAPEARAADSAYGPLQPADANGLMLPPGFTSREIARGGGLVRRYAWHLNSDGQATFPLPDGGWALVSNSESPAGTGGASVVRFNADGSIRNGYRVLSGTSTNCAGGGTPWSTWLSCEEYMAGHVWECNPRSAGQGVMRPAMGAFSHESVAVDHDRRWLYMTEDRPDGGLYRFRPAVWRDLNAGRLQIAVDRDPGRVVWKDVPDPSGTVLGPTRYQVAGTRAFKGGEGSWYDDGHVYFSTKGDNRIWSLDVATGALATVYDHAATPDAPLRGVDNLTVSRAGEIFVCEDGGDMEICVIGGDRTVAPFLRLTGEAAAGTLERGNELAGVVFDPSGERMYFAAQRAYGVGVVYEVAGPFLPAPATAPVALAAAVDPEAPAIPPAAGPGVRARRRIGAGRLRRRGLKVRVTPDRDGELLVGLRTDDLVTVPGARGSAPRPETVVLARTRRPARAGRPVTLRLRAGRGEARRLRRAGAVRASVTVVARSPDGIASGAVRSLRIGR